jgi:hypothetical protein
LYSRCRDRYMRDAKGQSPPQRARFGVTEAQNTTCEANSCTIRGRPFSLATRRASWAVFSC